MTLGVYFGWHVHPYPELLALVRHAEALGYSAALVDGDVSKVTEFMGGKPHPGMNRTSGSFGFAGHGDAVQFRNVKLKKL